MILAHKVIPEAQVRPETPARLAHRATQVRKVTPESVTLVCREILEHKATRGREIQARLAIPGLREIPVGRGTQANLVIQERELRETPG